MANNDRFYIGGAWVDPVQPKFADVINPATEEAMAGIAMGSAADVDRAAQAAAAAFPAFSMTTRKQRIDLLNSILNELDKRLDDIAAAMTMEMGAPSVFPARRRRSPGTIISRQW